jgi:hypothetical protein
MNTILETHDGREYEVQTKFGEVTSTPLYRVAGDDIWRSTPADAIRQHNKLSRAVYGGKEDSSKKQGR